MMGEDNTDLLLAKLLEPIERLGLNPRAYHALRRQKVQTVADIIYLGEENISKFKNMGALLVKHIFASVANYLDVPGENLSSGYLKQIVLAQNEESVDPLQGSIAALNLSNQTIRSLQAAQIFRVDDLIKSRSDQYKNIAHFGKKFTTRINRELDAFLSAGIHELREKNIRARFKIEHPKINLGKTLSSIKDRTWVTLDLRVNHSKTLEEISTEIGGCSRERIRQIIEQACRKALSKNSHLLTDFLDYFELRAEKIKNELLQADSIALNSLISKLNEDGASSDLLATDDDTKKLVTLVRALVFTQELSELNLFMTKWSDLTFLCCLAEPPIKKHDKVSLAIKEKGRKSKKPNYTELAHSILQKAQEPMHWKEIAEKAYKIDAKGKFNASGIHGALFGHKDLFVKVGPGTYELAEWGNKTAYPYPEIIASVLKQKNCAMLFDALFEQVSAIRPIKRPSFIMYMELHPRFYKSINRMYGLRGWLPPKEKQTPRTPEWLVEDSKSLKRVERSGMRGYNIDKIIDEDKLIDQ